jgi:hypothetical protein
VNNASGSRRRKNGLVIGRSNKGVVKLGTAIQRSRRRRSSSLSRQAAHVLSTLDTTASVDDIVDPSPTPNDNDYDGDHHHSKNNKNNESSSSSLSLNNNKNHQLDIDSKASMVYAIPFDSLTGRCNYHPTVCMAVKEDVEKKNVGNTSSSGANTGAKGEGSVHHHQREKIQEKPHG